MKTITEELCGHEFTSSTINRIVRKLDEDLEQFGERRSLRGWSSWSVMMMLVCAARSRTRYRKRCGSAATCTFCTMRWMTCRAEPTMMVCGSCAGFYDRRDAQEARQDLAAWLLKWANAMPSSARGRKRTSVRCWFASFLTPRLACGRCERWPLKRTRNWIEAMRYLTIEPCKEQKKEALRKLADAA